MDKKTITIAIVLFIILATLGFVITRDFLGSFTTGMAGIFAAGSMAVSKNQRRTEDELRNSQELNSRISNGVSDIKGTVSDIRDTSDRLESLDRRADKFSDSSGDSLRKFDELLRKAGYPEDYPGD